jgi:UDP-N-acetylglucosamine:LPS N-acetylglucosamine transferase
MSKSVLFISIDGLTDALGQSQILPYMIDLSKRGFHIHILSQEKKNKYNTNHSELDTLLKLYQIEWSYVLFKKSRFPLQKIISLVQLFLKAKSIVKKNGIHLIHCRGMIPALLAYRLKQKININYIFDIRGFFIDEKIDLGTLKPNQYLHSKIIAYLRKKETAIYQSADAIVTITKNCIPEIYRLCDYNFDINRFTVIPTSVSYQLFNPQHYVNKAIKKELNIDISKKVLIYIGSLGDTYMLEEMLDFFKLIEHKNYVFLLVTNDPIKNSESLLSSREIPNKSLINIQASRKDIPKLLAIADMGISFIRPKYAKIASCPTKMGEMAAMGIPVICNGEIGDLDFVVEQYDLGAVVSEFSNLEYLRAFEKVKNMDKVNIREQSQAYFDLDLALDKYQTVYKNLLAH